MVSTPPESRRHGVGPASSTAAQWPARIGGMFQNPGRKRSGGLGVTVTGGGCGWPEPVRCRPFGSRGVPRRCGRPWKGHRAGGRTMPGSHPRPGVHQRMVGPPFPFVALEWSGPPVHRLLPSVRAWCAPPRASCAPVELFEFVGTVESSTGSRVRTRWTVVVREGVSVHASLSPEGGWWGPRAWPRSTGFFGTTEGRLSPGLEVSRGSSELTPPEARGRGSGRR